MNYINFEPKYVSIGINVNVGNGERYWIQGIRPVKPFKTGYKIKKGDTLGTVGYVYRNIPESCISFSRSINTKPADPMSIFGLNTSYVPPSCDKTDYLTKKHSIDKLKEDFNILRDALEEGHPGLYDYISKEEMDKLLNSVELKLNKPKTSEEFKILLLPIVREIRDSHTSLYAKKYSPYDYSSVPVLFGLKDKELKIFSATEEYKEYLNKSIVKVDGNEISDIIDQVELQTFAPGGFIESLPEHELFLHFGRYYSESVYKKRGDKLLLTFSDGSEKEFTYTKIKSAEFKPK